MSEPNTITTQEGATTLIRQFKMGATILNDPDPLAPVEKVIEMYLPAYPHLRNATIGEPTQEGNVLIFPLTKPAVQTKGREIEDVLSELDEWSNAPGSPDATVQGRWGPIYRYIASDVIPRPGALNDPFLLPLA